MHKKLNTLQSQESLLLISGFVALISVIFLFERPPFYDEDDYLQNVVLLHRLGFSKIYLLNHIGSAGPLYPSIHYFLESITHLQTPSIRLVNVLFLAGVTFLIGRSLVILKFSDGKYALTIMAIPMTYVVSGMALTEIPAMFFLAAGIYFMIKASHLDKEYIGSGLRCIVAGICISLAIVGRQPYVLVLAAVPIFFYKKKDIKRSMGNIIITLLFSLALPCYVFFIWKGLVAPFDASSYSTLANQGVSYRPDFFFLCIAYYAIVFGLIAPSFYIQPSKRVLLTWIVIFSFMAAVNLEFGFVRFLPLKPYVLKLLTSNSLIGPLEKLAGSALAFIAIYFLVMLAQQLHRSGYRKELLFFAFAILAIAVSCVKVTWGFTSRYAAQAIPLIIPIAGFFYSRSQKNILLLAIGIILGVMSLIGFFLNEH